MAYGSVINTTAANATGMMHAMNAAFVVNRVGSSPSANTHTDTLITGSSSVRSSSWPANGAATVAERPTSASAPDVPLREKPGPTVKYSTTKVRSEAIAPTQQALAMAQLRMAG